MMQFWRQQLINSHCCGFCKEASLSIVSGACIGCGIMWRYKQRYRPFINIHELLTLDPVRPRRRQSRIPIVCCIRRFVAKVEHFQLVRLSSRRRPNQSNFVEGDRVELMHRILVCRRYALAIRRGTVAIWNIAATYNTQPRISRWINIEHAVTRWNCLRQMNELIVGSISLLFVWLTYGTVYPMKSFPLTSCRSSKLTWNK